MKQLNVAVVGCGGMARFYCRRYQQLEGARLALVVDQSREAAERIGRALEVPYSTDFADALAEEIDVVDISTPNHLHEEQAIAAILADKHVILQKPLAPTVEAGERILRAAQQSRRNVGMYMSMFNNGVMYDLHAMLRAGVFGEIEGVHCRNAHRGGLTMPAGTWRGSLEKCGGGSLIQLAIHSLDAVQWLLGSEIESVMAFSHNRMCPNVGGDDATAVACCFDNGVLGTVESSYCADRSYLGVYGTRGYFLLTSDVELEIMADGGYVGEHVCYDTPGRVMRLPVVGTVAAYEQPNPHDQSIAFVRAVLEGKPAPVPVAAGVRDLRIIRAIYSSAEQGTRVYVR